MILVTGATGKTGLAVIQALTAHGENVRAFIRTPDYTNAVKQAGAADVFIGDLVDPIALTQALENCRAVYHICPNVSPHEVEIGQNVIQAALANNVQHFVYHSVIYPHIKAMPHHWHKMHVEERLIASGLPFTILQPTAYMQNILQQRTSILVKRTYAVPYSATTRVSLVDLRDVAAAAAHVLTTPGHEFATYQLSGPDSPSQQEIAQLLSQVIGKQVNLQETPYDVWDNNARNVGLGDYQRQTLLQMFRYYQSNHMIGNSNTLAHLINEPPTTLKEFLHREF